MFKLLKHVGKVLLTGTVVVAEKLSNVVAYFGRLYKSAEQWVCGTFTNKPTSLWEDVKKNMRMSAFRELMFFIGGLACIFLFDDARGDLTWFRRMITSVGDFFGNVVSATARGIQEKVLAFFIHRDQEVNEM